MEAKFSGNQSLKRVDFMYKTARNIAVLGTGLGISAVVGWLFLREHRRNQADDAPVLIKSQLRADAVDMPNIVLPLDAIEDIEQENPSTTPAQDDLTQINDIGPRFAEALHAIGITNYALLAAQTPEILAEKLLPYVRVSAQRIQDKKWITQAAKLANH
ncbi:MAG: hypothetical protein JXA10_18680 [Anaerolineae bacterium]|nr:hypothetical protein [Anaerolineae bacterium]